MVRGSQRRSNKPTTIDHDSVTAVDIEGIVKSVLQSDAMLQGISKIVRETVLPLEKRIKQLEDELFELKLAHDDLATYDRRTNLRFYGLPEQDGEDTCQLIIQTCASIGVNVKKEDISISHRVGLVYNKKKNPRAIICRFIHYRTRQFILQKKKNLDKQISVNEDLTKDNLTIYRYARQKLGKRSVYTLNGKVMYRDGAKRTRLISTDQIDQLLDD
ncbi:unnamed protein product [Didymodactylos carnosus]|uniref:Uncharacterized protein n=1 Tax=Didymodactylos carnosus TaxID=1234261 RepID=A0A8S2JC85_9BILA|nr:unnamed protein product [Didymodactylos carnosus]CAF3804517.1 unnamed protein product [Didymodactylos carnosus]CAF4468905.1 unnamed protein product [Didymodactylos carnosus]